MDLVCPICTESLTSSDHVICTPCGHLYHHNCLHLWLDRSKSCPQCRFGFGANALHKIYFNVGSFMGRAELLQNNNDLKLEIAQKTKRIEELKSKEILEQVAKIQMTRDYNSAQDKIRSSSFLVDTLEKQLLVVERANFRYKALRTELRNSQRTAVELIGRIIGESDKEAEDIMNRAATIATTLAAVAATLKRNLVSSEEKRVEIISDLENSENECKMKVEEISNLEKEIEQLEKKNNRLKNQLVYLGRIGTSEIDENAVLPVPLEPQRACTFNRSNTTGLRRDSSSRRI